MRVALFSSKRYDRQSFEAAGARGFSYIEAHLGPETVAAAAAPTPR